MRTEYTVQLVEDDYYIDEAWCSLCGYRTDGGPCPQRCPSES